MLITFLLYLRSMNFDVDSQLFNIFNNKSNLSLKEEVKDEKTPSQKIISSIAAFVENTVLYHGYIYQCIKKGAFDDVLKSGKLDVVCLMNHDYNYVLARKREIEPTSNTLELNLDEDGNLIYSFEPSEKSFVKDLEMSLSRKEIYGSSIQFTCNAKGVNYIPGKKNELSTLEIHKVSNIFDVGPAVTPVNEKARMLQNSQDYIEFYKNRNRYNNFISRKEKIDEYVGSI